MMFGRDVMDVRFHGRDVNTTVQVEAGTTVRKALEQANVLPSMVIVSYEGTVLPHSTPLQQEVELLVTTISSGG
jgi:sulfur carrier protein ThiS